MNITLATYRGTRITPWLDAVARLRLTVFRDFPYLYDGDMDYERRYLTTYASSPDSLFVLALHNDDVVGASTAIALTDAEPEFQTPFIARQIPLDHVLYFGESVLLQPYRGHSLGHRFFDAREAFARELHKTITSFCAVERPDDHPLRPAAYTPLDTFWQQRGYHKQNGMRTHYCWQDINEQAPSDKTMVFWLRDGSTA